MVMRKSALPGWFWGVLGCLSVLGIGFGALIVVARNGLLDGGAVGPATAAAAPVVAPTTATFCEPAVQAGRLHRLLPGYTCAPLRVYALLPAKRLMPAKVRIFLDALGRQAGVAA